MTSSSSLHRIFGWRNMGLLHSSTLSLFIPHRHRCCFSSGLIDIHAVQVEGGGSRTVYHHVEVTARYMKDFCFRNLLLKSASFCWLRRQYTFLYTLGLKTCALGTWKYISNHLLEYFLNSRLTRVNSTNVLDKGLWIGGKATTRDSGSEIGTRCTLVHVPMVEDRYILLAI
jgi:hypothetical protein